MDMYVYKWKHNKNGDTQLIITIVLILPKLNAFTYYTDLNDKCK